MINDEPFELVAAAPEPLRRRHRARSLKRAGDKGYTEDDHQWLITLCSRHLTIREYARLYRKRRYFKDYPALLQAAVIYFGHTQLGWEFIGVEKPLNLNRNVLSSLVTKIETLRSQNDVFERIDERIEIYRHGLL